MELTDPDRKLNDHDKHKNIVEFWQLFWELVGLACLFEELGCYPLSYIKQLG